MPPSTGAQRCKAGDGRRDDVEEPRSQGHDMYRSLGAGGWYTIRQGMCDELPRKTECRHQYVEEQGSTSVQNAQGCTDKQKEIISE